jgi:hypothetical protein
MMLWFLYMHLMLSTHAHTHTACTTTHLLSAELVREAIDHIRFFSSPQCETETGSHT